MKHLTNFLGSWQDTSSLNRLRKSDKSKDVQKAEIENHLKSMSMRFERSPQSGIFERWASDLIAAGYEDWMVEEVCKVIPFKFDRHPTLSQLLDILRPHLAHKRYEHTDELDKYTQLVIPHLKAKFLSLVGQEIFDKMIKYYEAEVLPGATFGVEIAMLGDWCRAYMTKEPKKIIEQGKISNEAAAKGDRDYFIRPLRLYAREQGLTTGSPG